jgi:hypothetical protein
VVRLMRMKQIRSGSTELQEEVFGLSTSNGHGAGMGGFHGPWLHGVAWAWANPAGHPCNSADSDSQCVERMA